MEFKKDYEDLSKNYDLEKLEIENPDLDRMKIEEQKKAVRAGYNMDIIPLEEILVLLLIQLLPKPYLMKQKNI